MGVIACDLRRLRILAFDQIRLGWVGDIGYHYARRNCTGRFGPSYLGYAFSPLYRQADAVWPAPIRLGGPLCSDVFSSRAVAGRDCTRAQSTRRSRCGDIAGLPCPLFPGRSGVAVGVAANNGARDGRNSFLAGAMVPSGAKSVVTPNVGEFVSVRLSPAPDTRGDIWNSTKK